MKAYRNCESRGQEQRTVLVVLVEVDRRVIIENAGNVVRCASVIERVARADGHELREPHILRE